MENTFSLYQKRFSDSFEKRTSFYWSDPTSLKEMILLPITLVLKNQYQPIKSLNLHLHYTLQIK